MAGIVSIDCYIPFHRINKGSIYNAWGWFDASKLGLSKGELAFASFDEDSITMAVEASLRCLKGIDRKKVNRLYFVSSSPVYAEPSNTAIILSAVDLKEDTAAIQLSGSLKSSTDALMIANDSIFRGRSGDTLICFSDDRKARPADVAEYTFGNASAAMVIGEKDSIADIEYAFSYPSVFPDSRRTQQELYPKGWEDRWIRDEGFVKQMKNAIFKTMGRIGTNLSDFSKVIYSAPDLKTFKTVAKILGLKTDQIEDPLLDRIGFTGSPHMFFMLINAFYKAKPNDRIMLVGYGGGIDIVILKVTERLKKYKLPDLERYLDTKATIDNYTQFLSLTGKIDHEKGPRGEVAKSAVSAFWRERKAILGLYGSKCKRCSTKMYPAQHVCVNPSCRAIDEMEEYRFAEVRGRLFTYTVDNLAFSPHPPAIYGIVDFEDGGRYWFDITDCKPDDLYVGMPVRMSFRRKFYDKPREFIGYFWKATPVR